MACQDNYIQLDRSTTARSGLYASDLPGVEIALLEGLVKDEQNHYLETWEMIYGRSWSNLVSDIATSLHKKFYVDSKLLARETSAFKAELNSGSGLAGVSIEFELPKYARIHIISISVDADSGYASPGIAFQFYEDDADGELLHTENAVIQAGKNTINIDQDFEVDKLFIAYDRDAADFKQTENRYYPSNWLHFDKLACMWPCSWGGKGEVRQINEGGINVKYTVVCSIEKFVCENINLFAKALWYRVGLELTVERRYGNRLNEFTTMTIERATELTEFFNAQYQQALTNAVKGHNIKEDPICFNCKNVISHKVNLP